jgi:hypothetical protein
VFSVDCAPLSDFDAYGDILVALASVKASITRDAPTARPSYQFDYGEIGLDTVKRVLVYAGIAATNTPLGVSGSFEPITKNREWVVFPLHGLRKHFESIAREAVKDFDRCGSLDAVVQARGVEMTPGDQLLLAVLECLNFCEENKLILAFAW